MLRLKHSLSEQLAETSCGAAVHQVFSFFTREPVVLADASSKPSLAMTGRRQSPVLKNVPSPLPALDR